MKWEKFKKLIEGLEQESDYRYPGALFSVIENGKMVLLF